MTALIVVLGGKMTCSYLCKNSFECSLKRGGVFVPLQEHFDKFCLTDDFIHCSHFIRFAKACGIDTRLACGPTPPTLSHIERRSYIRKDVTFPVILSSYDGERVTGAESSANALAQTVDLSQGGMRVRAMEPVALEGVLFFDFGEGFIAPLLHGLAEVCWQKTTSEQGHWEAGLSFKNQFIKALIAVNISS